MLQTLVEQCSADDPDTEYNMGCVLFKVYTLVLSVYTQAMHRKSCTPSFACIISCSKFFTMNNCTHNTPGQLQVENKHYFVYIWLNVIRSSTATCIYTYASIVSSAQKLVQS